MGIHCQGYAVWLSGVVRPAISPHLPFSVQVMFIFVFLAANSATTYVSSLVLGKPRILKAGGLQGERQGGIT
jgi:hypothetical protein